MSAKARLHHAICSRFLAGENPLFLAVDYRLDKLVLFEILRAGLTHKRIRTKR